MEKKLLKNLDKMVWKNIKRLSNKDLDEFEEDLKIKFPEEDKKYIKAYNHGEAQNIVFKMFNDSYKVNVIDFMDYLKYSKNNSFNYFEIKKVKNYFQNRKLIPLITGLIFENRRENHEFEKEYQYEIYEDVKDCTFMYDFTTSPKNPDIICVCYTYEQKIKMPNFKTTSKLLDGSIIEEKIGKKILDLFKYMYIENKKIDIEKITWEFKENATKEEIEEFQKEIGLKFPKKYLDLLNYARERSIEYYSTIFKKKVPENVVDTGNYISLKDIKENYNIFLKYHKPYPKKLIPIRECGGGDYICLDYRGKLNTTLKEPKITYYVHDEIGNRRFIHLADSYDKFLDMIEIDEEEIERREKEIEESYFYGEQPLEDD